jgi:PPK2 family polyphosphate:nucleotide phosphotransferase
MLSILSLNNGAPVSVVGRHGARHPFRWTQRRVAPFRIALPRVAPGTLVAGQTVDQPNWRDIPMPKIGPKRIAEFIEPFRVEPGRRVRLPRDFDPAGTRRRSKAEAKAILAQGTEMLAEYQMRLAAQDDFGVIVVLQAMDAAGKDGTIRHVMSGVNPQGVQVSSFKIPTSEDLNHDYLWRYQKKLPERGNIGIFNRSYYEEVLVVRVHPQILANQKIPAKLKDRGIWKRRFREINDWEHYLTDQGYRFVKLFLNLSKEEQRRRFLARIDEPDRNWKFSANDAKERMFWDDYQKAFAEVLSNTSTPWAPWYVIPADDKPFARVAAAGVLAHTLIDIGPRFPRVSKDALASLATAKVDLEAQVPPGASADPIEAELAEAAARSSKKGRKS